MTTSSDPPGSPTLTISVATVTDLPDVLGVQRDGFGRVAAAFGIDPSEMSPLRETLSEIADLHAAGVVTFIARENGIVVGTVRATRRDDGVIEIGRLAVAGGSVRRGVATSLMTTLEDTFPQAVRFELFTGADAAEPLALYDRLGYRIFRREKYGAWEMVWLAKDRPQA